MARSSGRHSYGTKIQMDAAGGTSFTDLAELKSITGPNSEVDMIDLTHLTSDDRHKEYEKGFIDGGEVKLAGNFVPTAHAAFITALQAAVDYDNGPPNFKILWFGQSTKTVTFRGWPKGFEPSADGTKQAEFSGSIKVTGKPTFAAS